MPRKVKAAQPASSGRRRVDRSLLFTPCRTKEELHDWILAFLGLELPDGIVDPDSTSSPMDFVWEVYSLCFPNNKSEVSEIMGYAGRASYKTLAAAVLEVLAVYHHRRDVVHLAAIEKQSLRAQGYVRKFLERPGLCDFLEGGDNNRRTLGINWYERDGAQISASEYEALGRTDREQYEHHSYEIQVVVCTPSGVQGPHAQFMCVTGDTEVLVECVDQPDVRRRRPLRANGLFRLVAGENPSGNWRKREMHVREPARSIRVLSVNLATGQSEYKPITAAICRRSETWDVVTDRGSVAVTLEHPLYAMGRGFVQAAELRVGDRLLKLGRGQLRVQKVTPTLFKIEHPVIPDGDPWDQLLLGSLLGDGSVYVRGSSNPYFAENHCQEQRGYLEWKKALLSTRVTALWRKGRSGYTGREQPGIYSHNSALFRPYVGFRRTLAGVERLSALGLAIWYMDDGCAGNGLSISSESFTQAQNEYLVKLLRDKFNIETFVQRVVTRDGREYYRIRGDVAAKRRLVEMCAQYVHPDLAYKFDLTGNSRLCAVCGSPFWFVDVGRQSKTCNSAFCREVQLGSLHYATIISIARRPEPEWVFDFTVADNHNFVTNSFLSKNCVDEVDTIANPQSYQDAKMIPDERADRGMLPITVYISTRKSSFGLVQKEIDNAPKTGMEIRHWNIIDVTQTCPPERHLPDRPRLPIYVDNKNLEAIRKEVYAQLPPDRAAKFERREGFEGCLTNCKMFAACLGRLATRPPSTAATLKSVRATQLAFSRLGGDPVTASSQLLSRKPTNEGLIYQRLDPDLHLLNYEEIAAKLALDSSPSSPEELWKLLIEEHGARWSSGVDFGFSHNFAFVLALVQKPYCIVWDAIEVAGLETQERIALVNERFGAYTPDVWPDMADPTSIKSFRRAGYTMRHWKKNAGSVQGGIQIVQGKLRPTTSEPELLFLRDSAGAQLVFDRLSKYHKEKNAQGEWTDVPSEEGDDVPDALRYMVMNEFPVVPGGVRMAPTIIPEPMSTASVHTENEQERYGRYFEEMMRASGYEPPTVVRPIRKGKLTLLC